MHTTTLLKTTDNCCVLLISQYRFPNNCNVAIINNRMIEVAIIESSITDFSSYTELIMIDLLINSSIL